ncbi:MAG: CapA family protein [Bacilli bacterium]|nr:CapA family protein [Bacilli bacterium]
MAKFRLKKKARVFIILCVLVFAITIALVSIFSDNSIKFDVKNKISGKAKNKEVWPKISKLSLVATGDALLHNSVYIDAYNRQTETFDFSKQIEFVKEAIKDYDIKYYNQESVFGGKQPDIYPDDSALEIRGYHSFPFNSPSEFGDAMIDAGFNMVSLASNHSADCKTKAKECILNSYDYWSKQEGVVFDGFNPDENHTNNYIIAEKNGITYTMLNYTTDLNGWEGYVRGNEWLVDLYDEEKVKQDIEEVRDKVDVLIVAMHWHHLKNHTASPEYSFTVTDVNKEIAQYLSSLGVDIILGTYSHCLQPFDIINEGKTVVFYSLGNFISNQGVLLNSIGYKGIMGVLASMDITKTLYEDGTKEIKVDNLGAELLYTYSSDKNFNTYYAKNHKVIPFSKMNETYDSKYVELYNDYSEVLTSLNKNITIKPLPAN